MVSFVLTPNSEIGNGQDNNDMATFLKVVNGKLIPQEYELVHIHPRSNAAVADFSGEFARLVTTYLLTCTCVGIHPGRVEPASPIALATSRTEAFQARRSCASSLDTFTQSCLHRAWPKTRGPEIDSRSALNVVAHVISWPPVRLRHVRGDVGRRRSLISSPSGRLAT